MKACAGKKAGGKRCGAKPRAGRKWCWFHDPASAEARAAAQANGGAESRNRVGPAKVLGKKAPPVDVSGEEPIRGLVRETIDQVRRGELAPNAGQVIGQLLTVALKALKQDETEREVAELKERVRVFEELTKEELLQLARGNGAASTPPAPGVTPN